MVLPLWKCRSILFPVRGDGSWNLNVWRLRWDGECWMKYHCDWDCIRGCWIYISVSVIYYWMSVEGYMFTKFYLGRILMMNVYFLCHVEVGMRIDSMMLGVWNSPSLQDELDEGFYCLFVILGYVVKYFSPEYL